MINKYKIYSKINSIFAFSEFPSFRILKFKRSKWKNLKLAFLKKKAHISKKKNYKNKRFIKTSFVNSSIFKQRFSFFTKLKKTYKIGLNLKNSLYQFFDGGLSIKYLKKQCFLKKKIVYSFLIKPYYKLDILLWKLKFFSSIRQAHQNIKSKKILVNTKVVNNNFFLKKGDIIHILNKNINLVKNYGLSTSFILSFCDVDLYSYKVIILKELDTINEKDFTLFFNDTMVLKNVIYYLKKK